MSRRQSWGWLVLAIVVAVLSLSVAQSDAKEVPRISKEELKGELGNASLVLLDVRAGKDWTASDVKIQGAVREDPKDFEAWASKYPKDKKIVLYCA